MYFFLCNLSFQDIVYVSTTLPNFLSVKVTGKNNISFIGCATQMFLFALSLTTETFLLSSMAYDRYVAICMPLHYVRKMSKNICTVMATASRLIGAFNALTLSFMVFKLEFCHSKDIDHFYCDMKTMIKLSSGDTKLIQSLLFVACAVLGFFPVALILASYTCIVSTIMKMRTTTKQAKVFSSCSSHLIVVFLFYGPSLGFYARPESVDSVERDKLLSLLYTAVIPMLNPLVYSLRNQDVLKAMKKTLRT
ncbi:olfactory receptor 2M5-like [Pelodytes ibericus]